MAHGLAVLRWARPSRTTGRLRPTAVRAAAWSVILLAVWRSDHGPAPLHHTLPLVGSRLGLFRRGPRCARAVAGLFSVAMRFSRHGAVSSTCSRSAACSSRQRSIFTVLAVAAFVRARRAPGVGLRWWIAGSVSLAWPPCPTWAAPDRGPDRGGRGRGLPAATASPRWPTLQRRLVPLGVVWARRSRLLAPGPASGKHRSRPQPGQPRLSRAGPPLELPDRDRGPRSGHRGRARPRPDRYPGASSCSGRWIGTLSSPLEGIALGVLGRGRHQRRRPTTRASRRPPRPAGPCCRGALAALVVDPAGRVSSSTDAGRELVRRRILVIVTRRRGAAPRHRVIPRRWTISRATWPAWPEAVLDRRQPDGRRPAVLDRRPRGEVDRGPDRPRARPVQQRLPVSLPGRRMGAEPGCRHRAAEPSAPLSTPSSSRASPQLGTDANPRPTGSGHRGQSWGRVPRSSEPRPGRRHRILGPDPDAPVLATQTNLARRTGQVTPPMATPWRFHRLDRRAARRRREPHPTVALQDGSSVLDPPGGRPDRAPGPRPRDCRLRPVGGVHVSSITITGQEATRLPSPVSGRQSRLRVILVDTADATIESGQLTTASGS